MIFKRVYIQNFFCIADEMTWNLESQGLVCIIGENRDSSAADSNGSGKSTLFEALVWCLWGKTVRGQSGDEVVNRKVGKDCRVSVFLEDNGIEFQVVRHRKHKENQNKLHLWQNQIDLTQGTNDLTQEKLDRILGIDYDTFIRGPMMPQGAFKRFSAMTDAEQKSVLEQALLIGILAAALAETKERISRVTNRLVEAESKLEQTELDIAELQEQRDEQFRKRGTWKKTRNHSMCEVASELAQVVSNQETAWENLQTSNIGAAIAEAKKKIEEAEAIKSQANDAWFTRKTELQAALTTLNSDHAAVVAQRKRLMATIESMEKLSDTSCPTCSQTVSKTYVDRCLEDTRRQYKDACESITGSHDRIAQTQRQLSLEEAGYQERYRGLINDHTEAVNHHLKLVTEASTAEHWVNEIAALNRQETTLRKSLRRAQSERSPYDDMIVETERKLLELTAKLNRRKSMYRGLELQLHYLEFWKTGFSNQGLKSAILESVTPFLNERVNRYLRVLTGEEIKVTFQTKSTLKSGDTREKFAVLVENLNGADSYAGNSGGEKGRADLAISFTMSDLVSARAQRPYPQRFLDEPFENLDDAGIEAVMELLGDMATAAGSIFVITHQESMKGLFPKTLTTIKQNGRTVLKE